jgi:hypothetical protein
VTKMKTLVGAPAVNKRIVKCEIADAVRSDAIENSQSFQRLAIDNQHIPICQKFVASYHSVTRQWVVS